MINAIIGLVFLNIYLWFIRAFLKYPLGGMNDDDTGRTNFVWGYIMGAIGAAGIFVVFLR